MRKLNQITTSSIFLCVLILGLSGCGAITSPNLDLVKQYKQPVQVEENETLVYVIRESAFAGGARGLWIGHNKHIVGDIGSGEYVYFKVPKGINTINAVQAKTGFGYYAVDATESKEPVFIKYEYTTGQVIRLSKEMGITYAMNYKTGKQLNNEVYNDGYEKGVMNLAMFSELNIMSKANELLQPDENTSIITFMKPSEFARNARFSIWSDSSLVGNLYANDYFQVRVPAGKHYFYTRGQVYYALEANIVAGKNYAVELDISMGWTEAHAKLKPINLNEENIDSILKSLNHIKLNNPLDDNILKRTELAQPTLKIIKSEILSGKKIPNVLPNNFGK